MISLTVQCIMFSIPSFLHLISIYIIYKAKHTRLQSNQRLYLIHLSISEFLTCFVGIIKRVAKLYNEKHLAFQVHIAQAGIATFVYYFVMIALTMDRFFEIYLNIRYPMLFTERLTHYVIGVIWFLSACFTVFLYVTQTTSSDINDTVLLYFYPSFGILCVVVAILTYAYIIRKIYGKLYRNNNKVSNIDTSAITNLSPVIARHRVAINNVTDRTTTSNAMEGGHLKILQRQLYKKITKGIYFPILLILTFASFIVVPEIIYFYYGYFKINMSETLRTVLTTSYFVAFTSDVIIYVLASKPIRETIFRKFNRQNSIATTSHRSRPTERMKSIEI